jgi:hypothetical protein
VYLRAAVGWVLVEYRGQVRDYGVCLSGLDRCETYAACEKLTKRKGKTPDNETHQVWRLYMGYNGRND